MFSAVVAFHEGTFHEINNADWITNADLWWLFVVRLNKLLNKQSRVELAQQLIQVNDKEISKVCITLYVWGTEQYSII